MLKKIIWGLLLVSFAIPIAQRQRGYSAFGGEYLLMILPLITDELFSTVKGMLKNNSLTVYQNKKGVSRKNA